MPFIYLPWQWSVRIPVNYLLNINGKKDWGYIFVVTGGFNLWEVRTIIVIFIGNAPQNFALLKRITSWVMDWHISLSETINQLFLSYPFLQLIALAFHADAPPLLQSIATRVQHSLTPASLRTVRLSDQEHVLVFEGICRPPGHVRHSNFSSSSLKMPGGTTSVAQ